MMTEEYGTMNEEATAREIVVQVKLFASLRQAVGVGTMSRSLPVGATVADLVQRLVRAGALIQLTAASITGGFGKRPLYWSERMLDEGIVDFVATDAHNVSGRPPILSAARDRLIQIGRAHV